MSLLGRLALLFVVLPVLELVLLIQLGRAVGLLPTLALVLATGFGGAWLARAEGLRVLFELQRELVAGRIPGQALLDGIAVLLGGALLLTPGVLTDAMGLSILFPPTRRWLQRRVLARLERGISDGSIQVISTSAAGMGFGWTGGAPGRAGEQEPGARPLDPRHGIVIEPDDDPNGGA